MSDIYTCPECNHEFEEDVADTTVKKIQFTENDDAIQATSLIFCPSCNNVVVAVFDSMECYS